MIAMLVKPADALRPHSTRENAMTRAFVLGAAALTLSAGAASAQAVYPSYGYGPYGYDSARLFPGSYYSYTAQSVVVSQPLYDYAPGYWGADIGGWPPVAAAPDSAAYIPARSTRHYGHRMYMMTVNRSHKGSKLTPANNANPQM